MAPDAENHVAPTDQAERNHLIQTMSTSKIQHHVLVTSAKGRPATNVSAKPEEIIDPDRPESTAKMKLSCARVPFQSTQGSYMLICQAA